MRKFGFMLAFLCFGLNVQAAEIKANDLGLSAEQNQKLVELKNNLNAEIQPIWEEIDSSRQRITEIEKKYFEEFWNMLSDEQKAKFAELNK